MQNNRFAHSEGHTEVCYDDVGSALLTCGSDGDLRIWNGIDDDDATSHRIGQKVCALAFKNGRFFTASDTNAVQAHLYPSGALDGIVTRFTSPVTHMCINDVGSHLLAGASDFLLKLVEIETFSQTTFQGHEAPVLSVDLDPLMKFVASSSCDGTLKIWNIEDGRCVHTESDVVAKCNDFSSSKVLCRMSWQPKSGKLLAYPDGCGVKVLDRQIWRHSFSLTQDHSQQLVSIASFSPCGKYLAASTLDGVIVVWDVVSRKVIHSFKHEKRLTICSLAWNPKNNGEIGFCDNHGNLGTAEHCLANVSQTTEQENQASLADLFDDDDGAGWDEGSKHSTAPVGQNDSDDDDDLLLPTQRKAQPMLDDDNSVDIDAIAEGAETTDGTSVVSGRDSPAPTKTVYVQQAPKTTPVQTPFQPGSSPAHLSSRFMVWNSVGIIKQYNTEEENSIDIEFHDTATHHAMHVLNTANYTMASMSHEAVVLAAESDSENDAVSSLLCMHFNSWDNSKEWSVGMPDGEDIQCVTIGESWLAAATDRRNVRLFSVAGVQWDIFTLPGPVVTMAAHSNQLLIAYHMGAGIPGDQCMGYHLYQVSGRKRRMLADRLPLSRKATLSWLGFSAEGTPFAVDSAGIVRLLNRKLFPSWVQVGNTKSYTKGKSDHYWIVGINENPQQLRCIPCKGSTYPPTLPRPAVSILPFQVPVCELSTEKGQLEETLWRSRVFSGHVDFWRSQGLVSDDTDFEPYEKTETEALMKLFALACKADREYRALEICHLMPSQHALQLAIKYASKMRHLQLAQQISELAQQREEQDQGVVENATEDEAPRVFSDEIQAGYNHTETEWSSHVNGYHDNGDAMVTEEEEEPSLSGPMLVMKDKSSYKTLAPNSQGQQRKNPFKVGTESKVSNSKGTKVFDNMSRPTKSKLTVKSPQQSKKKNNLQPKMFTIKKGGNKKKTDENTSAFEGSGEQTTGETKKPVSAFTLWLDDNRAELEEEFPDMAENDLVVMATERFRDVPKTEKKTLAERAKQMNNSEMENKKRKRDGENESEDQQISKSTKAGNEDSPAKKKPLTQSTNSKLAGFKFDKN